MRAIPIESRLRNFRGSLFPLRQIGLGLNVRPLFRNVSSQVGSAQNDVDRILSHVYILDNWTGMEEVC